MRESHAKWHHVVSRMTRMAILLLLVGSDPSVSAVGTSQALRAINPNLHWQLIGGCLKSILATPPRSGPSV